MTPALILIPILLIPIVPLCILANIFLIEFLRKGKGSEESLRSRVSQGQHPFERSMGAKPPSENDFQVFKLVFGGAKSPSYLFNGI